MTKGAHCFHVGAIVSLLLLLCGEGGFASPWLVAAQEAAAGCTTSVPLPDPVTITQPGEDVALELAAWSGAWEGHWGDIRASRVIVEQVDAEQATILYTVAAIGNAPEGWIRRTIEVQSPGSLEWTWGDGKFSFVMADDRASIKGAFDFQGRQTPVTMIRCSMVTEAPAAAQPVPASLPGFEVIGTPTSYNQTANHRSIWDLQYWHGRIYIGHGDWDANTGPVQALYLDTSENVVVHDQGFMFDDEAVHTFRVINDVLFALGADAKESWDFGNIYVKEQDNPWEKLRSLPRGVHVFDIGFSAGTFIASGSDDKTAGIVWTSGGGFRSWTVSNSFTAPGSAPPNNPLFVHGGTFSLKDKQYVTTANNQCLSFDGSAWAAEDCIEYYGFGVYRNAVFGDTAVMVPYGHGNIRPDRRLQMFNGHEKWMVTLSSNVRDVVATDDALFVLVGESTGEGAVLRATTLGCRCATDFVRVATISSGRGGTPYSLEYVVGRFYVGTADGRLLKSAPIE